MDNSQFDKPFKNYNELIDLMKSRNIIIDNEDVAIDYLSRISYYHLINGYKNLYPMDDEGNFLYEVHFIEFLYLDNFEREINALFLKYILLIEKSLKSNISYLISEKYGINTDIFNDDIQSTNDYLCRDFYASAGNAVKRRNNILRKIKKDAKRMYTRGSCLSLNHYIVNHNHLPAWILVNALTFGNMIQWFKILKPEDKEYVCDKMINQMFINPEFKIEFISRGLDLLRSYRNGIAHGNKIFASSITGYLPQHAALDIANGRLTTDEYNTGLGKRDVYSVILTISRLLDLNNKQLFLQQTITLLEYYNNNVYANGQTLLQMLALPENFISRLKAI
jgi:abortive infection bacteriophage resistance protein